MEKINDHSKLMTISSKNESNAGELQSLIDQKTAELEATQKSLESISYTISHDLRAPLRTIDSFSQTLAEDFAGQLPEEAVQHIARIRKAASHMRGMIDELLELARVNRRKMEIQEINLSRLAKDIVEEIAQQNPARKVEFIIEEKLETLGDKSLLKIALTHILQNAWKFTSHKEQAQIQFGRAINKGISEFFVRDNGIGFDMDYSEQLFEPFKRLHNDKEYAGMGVGLATAKQIFERHHGKIWTDSEPDQGACFYFSLGREYQMSSTSP